MFKKLLSTTVVSVRKYKQKIVSNARRHINTWDMSSEDDPAPPNGR